MPSNVMSSRSLAMLATGLALMACRQKSPIDAGLCGEVTGGITNEFYEFSDRNFSCQTDPIETAFDIDTDSFLAIAGLTKVAVMNDLTEAMAAWNATGPDLNLSIGNDDAAGDIDRDDEDFNILMYDGAKTEYYPDATASAATTILTGPAGYEPIAADCDVVFWSDSASGPYDYVADATPTSTQVDVAYIFAHELGHCVGIADQDAPSTAADIMYWAYTLGTDFSGLSADETEAALFLYGAA